MVLLWSGPEGTTPPACPSVAPQAATGYLDTPPADVACSPPCACSPSMGYCYEPDTLTGNATSCPAGDGGAPSDLPDSWDGTCIAESVSSTDSVTVGPALFGTMRQCAPTGGSSATIAGGATRALRCNNDPLVPIGACPDTDPVCAYATIPGFKVCFWTLAVIDCPAAWSDRHLYYDDDTACTCTCSTPTGDSCSSTVRLFSDGACSTEVGSVPVSADAPSCGNVPPGSSIGSVSATPLMFTSGTCTPTLTKSAASTMCCLQ